MLLRRMMPVVKSFLLGRTLDLNSLMTVTTILTIAFAIDCFYAFVFLDCEQSALTLPHHLLRFNQANPLGSDTCYGSVRPRNSLSDYLIRQTCLLPLILGRDLGSYQPTSYPHPA